MSFCTPYCVHISCISIGFAFICGSASGIIIDVIFVESDSARFDQVEPLLKLSTGENLERESEVNFNLQQPLQLQVHLQDFHI